MKWSSKDRPCYRQSKTVSAPVVKASVAKVTVKVAPKKVVAKAPVKKVVKKGKK